MQRVRIRSVDSEECTDEESSPPTTCPSSDDGGNSMYSSWRPSSSSYVKLEAAEPWSLQPIWKGFMVRYPMIDSDFDIIYDALMARRENGDLVELLCCY
jgi:hypothetical protein